MLVRFSSIPPSARTLNDSFGLRSQFVGLQNFLTLFRDPGYLHSFRVTAVFSVLVAVAGIAFSLLLAVMADRVVRGAVGYRTLLIWPYAVAPAVAGMTSTQAATRATRARLEIVICSIGNLPAVDWY